jgi:hypothetical protein
MKKATFITILIILFVVLNTNIIEAQCAMCKASVESSQGQKNSVSGGLNTGILYLMAVPYIVLMFIFRKQLIALWHLFRGKKVEVVEE